MIKSVFFSIGLAGLLLFPAAAPAQDDTTVAVNEAVLRQANTITLRQKLSDARATARRGDLINAAKLYQESVALAQQVGSGIDTEAAQALAGLVSTRLALAGDAQSHGNLIEADAQVRQVLKADPKNTTAQAFKTQNDQMLTAAKGRMPDAATLEQVPQLITNKLEAGTLVRDGKLFYEMGKLDEAEVKFSEAIKLNPDNAGAIYYLSLIQQAKFARAAALHNVDNQKRVEQVEKQWLLPASTVTFPNIPNPYATNPLVYTGPGRQAIIAKIDHTRLDKVAFDGLPLNEVLRNLSEQVRLRDPEKKGVNFLINPNGAAAGGGGGKVDPATGLPAAPAAGGGETADIGGYIVKIPSLNDVRLADVLDAIVTVSEKPIKYSIQDYAIVFQAKGAETPQLFMRTFKVDPNTFYSGLQSVSSQSFGASSSGGNNGGGNNGGGNNGGGNRGNNGGGNGNGNGNDSGGSTVGIVDAFGGGGGGGNGGRGGNRGNNNGNATPAVGAAGGAAGGIPGQGTGLEYITKVTDAATPSAAVAAFFTALGVNLKEPAGKAVFFNDRLGLLFVKATDEDLDIIERAIETLNKVPPQVHVKARFIEVEQDDNKQLGFDWYLGQFNMGNQAVGTGGTSPSLNVPTSVANPIGAFPGNTAASVIPPSATDQLLTGGLNNSGSPTIATFTGILTDPNFRVALHALETRAGAETLAEPEAFTTSGRQVQMRGTTVKNIITGVDNNTSNNSNNNNNNNNGNGNGNGSSSSLSTITYEVTSVELGPILDVVPYVLSDGYTINMSLIPSETDFLGYDTSPGFNIQSSGSANAGGGSAVVGYVAVMPPLPMFTVRQIVANVNVWDNQTVALGGLITSTVTSSKDKVPVLGDVPLFGRLFQSQSKAAKKKNLMIFVTATIVDPAGNRVHSDDDLPFAQTAVPAQPPGAGQVQETVKEVHSLPPANTP